MLLIAVLAVDVGNLLTTVLAVLAITTAGGLGLMRGTVTNLRENLRDARDEIQDKDRRLTECEKRTTQLSSDLDALSRVVTGEAHWVALEGQLEEHHREAMAGIKRIIAAIEQVPEQVENLGKEE